MKVILNLLLILKIYLHVWNKSLRYIGQNWGMNKSRVGSFVVSYTSLCDSYPIIYRSIEGLEGKYKCNIL